MIISPGGTMRMDFLSWDITIFHLLILAATGIPENTPSVSAKVKADAGFSVRFTDVSALKVTVPSPQILLSFLHLHLFPPCLWINEFSHVAFLASTVQRHCVFSIYVTSRRGRCLERATVDNMVLRNFIRYGNFKAGTDGRVHLDPHGCAVVGPK